MFTGVTRIVGESRLHHWEALAQSIVFISSSGSWSLLTLYGDRPPLPKALSRSAQLLCFQEALVVFSPEQTAAEQLAKCQGPGAPYLFHLSCNSTRATISLHFEKTEVHYLRYHFWVPKISVSWGTQITVTEFPNLCSQGQMIPYSPMAQAASKQLHSNPGSMSPPVLSFLACGL